jgi:putative glutamine amidotransferase
MKNILITQGLYLDERKNLYSKLDYTWYQYAKKLRFNLIPISFEAKLNTLEIRKIDGIIFSGGNNLNTIQKKKENLLRDIFEKKLFSYFSKKKIPILGVCRGMQLISQIHKIKIDKSKNHVTKGHDIILMNDKRINVNSYHNYIIKDVPDNFNLIAKHMTDNSIEIISCKKKNFLCLMFHPERVSKSQKKVDKIFKDFFKI